MARVRMVVNPCATKVIAVLAAAMALGAAPSATQPGYAVEIVEIPAEKIRIKPGDPLSGRALVSRPPTVPGVMSWSLETRRHRGAIYHVAISPDGKTLATGGLDGTIRLWDVDTGKFIKCLLGHNSYVYRLVWSPDGRTLASSGGSDSIVGLWDVKSGRLLRAVPSPKGYVTYVAWAPDGKRIAYASAASGYILVYDVVRGEIFNKDKDVGLGVGISCVEWTPDGTYVGFSSTAVPVLSLWEPSEASKTKAFPGDGDVTYSFSFAPDGKSVALAGAKNIRVFDFESTDVKRTIEAPAYTVAYSPDGKMLASAALNGVVQLWEAETGKAIKTLTGSATTSLSWSADSKLLATTTYTTAVVWDVESAKIKQSFDACGIYPPIWTPKKPSINGIYTNTPMVCDPSSGKRICKLEGHQGLVTAFAWSRDGNTLATGANDNTVRLWEMPSGTPLVTYQGHKGAVNAVAWMSDSKAVASASSDQTIRLWRVPDRKPASSKKAAGDKSNGSEADGDSKLAADVAPKSVGKKDSADPLIQEFKGHSGPVTQLVSPTIGKLLASGSSDKSIKLWSLTSNKLITTINVGYPVLVVSWSPDGKVLGSSAALEGLNFWNPTSGKLIKSMQEGKSSPTLTALTWSPNGSIIAVGRHGHSLQLVDSQSGKVLHSLGAMAPVMSATWTPSGQTVGSGCHDRTVRFWDAATGDLRGHLIAEETQVAAISADGHFKAEPGIEADLFYVVQTDKTQETLSISEFATKAKWKNNPAQVAAIGK